MEPILSICYAAFGGRDFLFEENVLELTLIPGVEVLIVWQRPENESWKRFAKSGIRVEVSEEIGISRSRNRALNLARGEYVWFQDDDTIVPPEAVSRLIAILTDAQFEAAFVRIGCLEDQYRHYKDYGRWSPSMRLTCLRISSIELIVKRRYALDKALRFPEDMGLGTHRPCGEESMFLLGLLDAGGRCVHIPEVAVLHTCTQDGRLEQVLTHYIAKGRVLRKLGSPWAAVVAARWVARGDINLGRLEIAHGLYTGWKEGKRR